VNRPYTLHAEEGTRATITFDVATHQLCSRTELEGVRAVTKQLLVVLFHAERQADADDHLAFEARAARAIIGEHLPQIVLWPPPEEE
jgi:hypothetical protein